MNKLKVLNNNYLNVKMTKTKMTIQASKKKSKMMIS